MTDGISDRRHRISDGGNSVSIEEKMDMLRRKIKDGALGADDARRALRAEIDGELCKAPADVDMDAVNACEALLAELSGAKEETHAAQNLRAIREKLHPQKRAPKRSAAVAVLLALLSLGVKKIHLGPTLPAFLSPNVAKVLVDTFQIDTISDVEDDLKMFQLS